MHFGYVHVHVACIELSQGFTVPISVKIVCVAGDSLVDAIVMSESSARAVASPCPIPHPYHYHASVPVSSRSGATRGEPLSISSKRMLIDISGCKE